VPDDRVRRRAERFFGFWNAEGVGPAAERFWDPGIVWEEAADFPDSAVHHGRDASVGRMRERFELLGSVQIEVVDTWGDDERMLVEAVVRGRGSTSGAPTVGREFFLLDLRAGMVTRFREFLDRDEALAAFGG
jgi:ketosteroid isomerase-like protein